MAAARASSWTIRRAYGRRWAPYFFSGRGNEEAGAFDAWLNETLTARAVERARRLIAWESAPGAIASHPEAEHLLPLHVVAGAAGEDAGRRTYHDDILGKAISAFQFG